MPVPLLVRPPLPLIAAARSRSMGAAPPGTLNVRVAEPRASLPLIRDVVEDVFVVTLPLRVRVPLPVLIVLPVRVSGPTTPDWPFRSRTPEAVTVTAPVPD